MTKSLSGGLTALFTPLAISCHSERKLKPLSFDESLCHSERSEESAVRQPHRRCRPEADSPSLSLLGMTKSSGMTALFTPLAPAVIYS